MKKIAPWLTGINLVVVITLLNVLLSFYPFLRVDLSKNRIHSLSSGTREIISDLDDVINIKVFMSADLPANVKPVADNLKTILDEFGRIKKTKLRVKYFDPIKDDEARLEAEKLGIRPLQFSTVKSDKFEVINGYLGLALIYGDKEVVLPVAGDVGNLEYFLVSGIKKLVSEGMKSVAIIEDSMVPGQSEIRNLREFLGRDYQVLNVDLGNTGVSNLPEEAETLVIVGNKSPLSDEKELELRSWVESGKGLVAFLDKVAVNQSMVAEELEDNNLWKLFEEKGMRVVDGLMWDESSTIANFQTQTNTFLIQYPYWLIVRPENINSEIPAVSGIESLMLPWVSPLELSGSAKPLFSSSERSTVDTEMADMSPTANLEQSPGSSLGKEVLAAVNTEEVKMAIVADSDFIKDQFVTGNGQNMVLALNLIDYISSDNSLLTIRSKTVASSPLKPIEDSMKTTVKVFNLAMPIILLMVGGIVSRLLRKKKNEDWD